MTVISLLDDACLASDPRYARWAEEVLESLISQRGEWLREVELVGGLSEVRAWAILSWAETMATTILRSRSFETLSAATFAIALARTSTLDRRDCSVVASVVHFAADASGLDFEAGVREGTRESGKWRQEGEQLMLSASAMLPSTHEVVGRGSEARITRKPSDFDLANLESWLKGGDFTSG